MNDKKMKLIESGLSLFAAKGYHATSIQEIADMAGVSKGSFYVYFDSKEDFVTIIFTYFNEQITQRLQAVQQKNLTPSQCLAEQITVLINYIYSYKSFIQMYLRENISIGTKMDTLIESIKKQNYEWLCTNIHAIYGDKVMPFLNDCVIQLEGIMNGYLKWIVFEGVQINRERLGHFIVSRLNDLVYGMLTTEEQPLVTIREQKSQQDLGKQMRQLTDKIQKLSISNEKKEELHAVVQALQAELSKTKPQKIMLQGLLVHFRNYPELEMESKQLASCCHVELL
ncbi:MULTISPECIES: TetR/AcrR family transcriptional regulator [unclassified Virgibacillus]|uniref:TetR/AcrR family transcriptional regulator n=1 Tax=unclassified Virgibacillus TaxID=2620237 RepID=UPI0024DE8A83|nr:TetR/AcrR family transcriptional regulator [Virgibacillus sp. LDC-1]